VSRAKHQCGFGAKNPSSLSRSNLSMASLGFRPPQFSEVAISKKNLSIHLILLILSNFKFNQFQDLAWLPPWLQHPQSESPSPEAEANQEFNVSN
jgi:hypothetical protein